MDRNQNRWLLSQATEDQTDEFQLEATPEDPYVESELDAAVELASPLVDEIDSPLVLIANRHLKDTAEATVERGSLIFDGSSDKPLVRLRVREMSEGQLTCPECGGHHGKGRLMFRAARLGAPFLLMQVIPTLLEFCPDGEDPQSKPLRGRRMITFTDSRQARQGWQRPCSEMRSETACVRPSTTSWRAERTSVHAPNIAICFRKSLNTRRTLKKPRAQGSKAAWGQEAGAGEIHAEACLVRRLGRAPVDPRGGHQAVGAQPLP